MGKRKKSEKKTEQSESAGGGGKDVRMAEKRKKARTRGPFEGIDVPGLVAEKKGDYNKTHHAQKHAGTGKDPEKQSAWRGGLPNPKFRKNMPKQKKKPLACRVLQEYKKRCSRAP